MRGRMSEAKSYVPPSPQRPLDGGAIGVVEASRHPDFAVGDRVSSMLGWRDRFVANGAQLTRLPDTRLPPQLFLGALGMPGMTAWTGLNRIAKLQAGETVLVSAPPAPSAPWWCSLPNGRGPTSSAPPGR